MRKSCSKSAQSVYLRPISHNYPPNAEVIIMSKGISGLGSKIANHLALLRRDPERFGRNLLQFTNPTLFEERLIDVLDAVPMHVRIDPALAAKPSLNILNAALSTLGMTGG